MSEEKKEERVPVTMEQTIAQKPATKAAPTAPPVSQVVASTRDRYSKAELQELENKMVGRVTVKAKDDASWPLDIDTFKIGIPKKDKLNVLPKCQDGMTVHCTARGYDHGLNKVEEAILEDKLYYPAGALNNSLTNRFWASFVIRFDGSKMELNLETPYDYLCYRVMLKHPKFANSLKEVYDWPSAEYVLSNPKEEAEQENLTVSKKAKAWALYSNTSFDELKEIVMIMGFDPETLSNKEIENKVVNELIEVKPEEFISYKQMPNRQERVLLEKLLRRNIVKKIGSMFKFQEHSLGMDKETAAATLAKDSWTTLRIELEKKVS